MMNLGLIETAPHWRVAVAALVAKVLGITINVEGIPFGSRRCMRPWPTDGMVSKNFNLDDMAREARRAQRSQGALLGTKAAQG